MSEAQTEDVPNALNLDFVLKTGEPCYHHGGIPTVLMNDLDHNELDVLQASFSCIHLRCYEAGGSLFGGDHQHEHLATLAQTLSVLISARGLAGVVLMRPQAVTAAVAKTTLLTLTARKPSSAANSCNRSRRQSMSQLECIGCLIDVVEDRRLDHAELAVYPAICIMVDHTPMHYVLAANNEVYMTIPLW